MGAPVAVENRAGLPVEAFARLAGAVACHRSMRHALDWLLAHTPPLTLTDMLTQDEFSHDFLAAYPGGLWLAYDST